MDNNHLPCNVNLYACYGDTFAREIRMRYKESGLPYESETAVAKMRLSRFGHPVMELSEGNGIENTNGAITVRLTPEETKWLGCVRFSYDLQLTFPDGTVVTVMRGILTIK